MKTQLDRFALAREVYQILFASTETFEDEDSTGSWVAYLLGAILMDNKLLLDKATDPFYHILKMNFTEGHPMWEHIVFVQ